MANSSKPQKNNAVKEEIPGIASVEVKHLHVKRKHRIANFLIAFFSVVIIVLLIGIILISVTLLRHRQLCAYKSAVDSGRLVSTTGKVLCRNPLDSSQWGEMITDIGRRFESELIVSLGFKEQEDVIPTTGCYDQLDPVCWLSQLQGDLAQTDGYTNLLIVGSDSHFEEVPGNTDTIMVASYHHDSGEAILISFPRDLLITHTDLTGSYVTNRINTLYPIYELYQDNGRETLNNAISQIIGKPIHYYAYFSFDAFLSVIDTLGGVSITLDEPFYDAFPCTEVPANIPCNRLYELGLPGYGRFEFPAGENHFDSFDALVYTRSRQLSNDFERAERQQNLIQAIIKNILENDIPIAEKFSLYTSMFSQLSNQVDTNVQLSDVSGLFKLVDSFSGDIAKVVVDPNLGGPNQIVYSAGVDPVYYYIVKFNDYSYKQFQDLINNIWEHLPYYQEQPKIKVSVLPGNEHLEDTAIQQFLGKGVPFAEFKVKEDAKIESTGIRIYDFSNGTKSSTLKDLKSRLPGALLHNPELESVTRSSFKEDISIVIGR